MQRTAIHILLCLLPVWFVQTSGQAGILDILFPSLNAQNNQRLSRPPTIDQQILNAAGADVFNSPVSDASRGELLLQGDMVMTTEQLNALLQPDTSVDGGLVRKKRKTVRDETKRWENNVVLMAVDSNAGFSGHQRHVLQTALDEWQQKTCIRFRTPTMYDVRQGRSFVLIQNGRGCSSTLGMNPTRTVGMYRFQPLTLAPTCRTESIMKHEVGHALGLFHEQSRSDRDGSITVIWRNVPVHMRHNFQKFTNTVTNNRNTPYDYQSLMHYGPTAFSTSGNPTIQTLDPRFQDRIGSFTQISQYDAEAINNMYRCGRGRRRFGPWWWGQQRKK